MNTNLMPAPGTLAERPWWSVRTPLLATLAVLIAILVSILTPTPLHAWVFGN